MEIITELKEGVFGLQMIRPENKNDVCSSDADLGDFLLSPPPAKGSPVLNFISAVAAASKPIAAAVCGLAIGIAITMLPHIERAYAAETPRFQLQIWSETVGSPTRLRSPEPAEAMKAFFEKRPPNFAQFA